MPTALNKRTKAVTRFLMSVSITALAAGCGISPHPLTDQEFAAGAAADRVAMFKDQAPLDRPLTLGDAIARVLRYNLDHSTKMMEEALALGQLDLERWDMLPKLTTTAGYVGRSDHATVTATDSVTGQPALANPFYSLDRDRRVADLTASWNLLDFGVSYVNARENADRVIIAEERRRKAAQNLVQEVRSAYWRALATQQLHGRVDAVIRDADQALKLSSKVEAEQLRNPLDALRYQQTLLESLGQLEAINHDLSSAKAELAALINVPPGSDFTLATPTEADMKLPEWTIPVEQMEELAFTHNPELHEQTYQSRIAVEETRKEFLKMLPGINLNAGRNYDSNSFLINNTWSAATATVSWNLFSLVSAPDRIHYARDNETLAERRRLALRMAVLAQVHVSRAQYESASRQYSRADALYRVESKIAAATAKRQQNDAQSDLERIGSATSAIAAELRRYQTLAQAQGALGRIEATLGIDPVPPDVKTADLDTLGKAITARLDAMQDPASALPAAEDQPASAPPPEEVAAAPAGLLVKVSSTGSPAAAQ
jgi:outer membrane protein TolC